MRQRGGQRRGAGNGAVERAVGSSIGATHRAMYRDGYLAYPLTARSLTRITCNSVSARPVSRLQGQWQTGVAVC